MTAGRPGWVAYAALVASAFAGCGKGGPTRYELSGAVTYDGKPVPAGVIFFNPDVSKGNDGVQGFAYIKDGRYDTRGDGKGTAGGPHLVVIQGFDGEPGRELPMGKPVFREYSAPADLPKADATRDFVVPVAGQ